MLPLARRLFSTTTSPDPALLRTMLGPFMIRFMKDGYFDSKKAFSEFGEAKAKSLEHQGTQVIDSLLSGDVEIFNRCKINKDAAGTYHDEFMKIVNKNEFQILEHCTKFPIGRLKKKFHSLKNMQLELDGNPTCFLFWDMLKSNKEDSKGNAEVVQAVEAFFEARQMGGSDDMELSRVCTRVYLQLLQSTGSTFLFEHELRPELFTKFSLKDMASVPQFAECVVVESPRVYLRKFWELENSVANDIRRKVAHFAAAPEVSTTHDNAQLHQRKGLPKFDPTRLSAKLTQEQRNAIELAGKSGIFLLTGGPGTGKTYCLGEMLRAWQDAGTKVDVATFTGRGAQNLMNVAGAKNAKTIHALLHAELPKDDSDSDKTHFHRRRLNCDVLVVDEASMIPLELMHEILTRLPLGSILVLLGDKDQIPPIEVGAIFRDLLDDRLSGLIPRAVLTDPKRHEGAKLSNIYLAAQELNAGRIPREHLLPRMTKGVDTQTQYVQIFSSASGIVERVMRDGVIKDPSNLQFITFTNKTVSALNADMREYVNPSRSPSASTSFRLNDRVMHLKNESGVSNGEIGKVKRVDDQMGLLEVEYDRNRIVKYSKRGKKGNEWFNLDLAYAMTVHKAQGCEFQEVAVIVDYPYDQWSRELLYTAFTRAKKKLILGFFANNALQTILAQPPKPRHSNLVERILTPTVHASVVAAALPEGVSNLVPAKSVMTKATTKSKVGVTKKPISESQSKALKNLDSTFQFAKFIWASSQAYDRLFGNAALEKIVQETALPSKEEVVGNVAFIVEENAQHLKENVLKMDQSIIQMETEEIKPEIEEPRTRMVVNPVLATPSRMHNFELDVVNKTCSCDGFRLRGRCVHLSRFAVAI